MDIVEVLKALKEGKKITAKHMDSRVADYVQLDKNGDIVDAKGIYSNIKIFNINDEFMIYETEDDKLILEGKRAMLQDYCKNKQSIDYVKFAENCSKCPLKHNKNKMQCFCNFKQMSAEKIHKNYELIKGDE